MNKDFKGIPVSVKRRTEGKDIFRRDNLGRFEDMSNTYKTISMSFQGYMRFDLECVHNIKNPRITLLKVYNSDGNKDDAYKVFETAGILSSVRQGCRKISTLGDYIFKYPESISSIFKKEDMVPEAFEYDDKLIERVSLTFKMFLEFSMNSYEACTLYFIPIEEYLINGVPLSLRIKYTKNKYLEYYLDINAYPSHVIRPNHKIKLKSYNFLILNGTKYDVVQTTDLSSIFHELWERDQKNTLQNTVFDIVVEYECQAEDSLIQSKIICPFIYDASFLIQTSRDVDSLNAALLEIVNDFLDHQKCRLAGYKEPDDIEFAIYQCVLDYFTVSDYDYEKNEFVNNGVDYEGMFKMLASNKHSIFDYNRHIGYLENCLRFKSELEKKEEK